MRPTLFAVLLLLLVPAAASAGGWATAGVENPPVGVGPGDTWKAQLTILQHGRTPLEGAKPAVVIKGAGGQEQRFVARPVEGQPGRYVADVVFPKAGRWSYTVDDGFTNAFPHTFPPVEIRQVAATSAPARPAAPQDGPPYLLIGLGLTAVALAGVGVTVTRRRRGALPA